MSVNITILSGRLVAEPEIKISNSSSAYVTFSLAVSDYKKDKNGEFSEEVDFFNCVVFGKKADFLHKNTIKGQEVTVFGKTKIRPYEKEGEKKSYTSVLVNRFEIGLPPKGNSDGSFKRSEPKDSVDQGDFVDSDQGDFIDDDIPF